MRLVKTAAFRGLLADYDPTDRKSTHRLNSRLEELQRELLLQEVTLRFSQLSAVTTIAATKGLPVNSAFSSLLELQQVTRSLVQPGVPQQSDKTDKVKLLQDARSRYKEAYGAYPDDPKITEAVDKLVEQFQCQDMSRTLPNRSGFVPGATSGTRPGTTSRTATSSRRRSK